MRANTHPWLIARAEYLLSHAPVIEPPSLLGDTDTSVLIELFESHAMCEFPHETSDKVPECSIEVVARASSKCGMPSIIICQTTCDMFAAAAADGNICSGCLQLGRRRPITNCWMVQPI